jgi:hypothetical protein
MSESVIVASSDGIIVSADRRVGSYIYPTLVDAEKYKLCTSGLIFFDGNKKLLVYEPPHNFVAFTYTGDGSINSYQLIEDLKQELPAGRLLIREYAEALLKLYSQNPDRYRFGRGAFPQNDSNNIYITGYDAGSTNALLYHIDLPFKPGPTPLTMHPSGLIISGVEDHLETAKQAFRQKQIEKIQNQITGARILGTATQNHEAKLRLIKNSGDPFIETFREMQDFAEFVIEYTAAEQARLNELPTVGGGTDLIRITKQRGVEIVRYERHFEVGERRPLADTPYNYVVLNCCGDEVKMQIDFELNNPLIESHFRYPTDESFRCLSCGTRHDLTELRKTIQRIVGYQIVVNEKYCGNVGSG